MESCNHQECCPDCNKRVKALEKVVLDRALKPEKVPIPIPPRYVVAYTYSGTMGAEILWQVDSSLYSSEEEAIAYTLTLSNVERIRIILVEGLEKYAMPDTLKKIERWTAEIVEFEDADEEG